jgi:hypothetical protein
MKLWLSLSLALCACSTDEVSVSPVSLTTHQASDVVREVASWYGITNPLVIAGVANHEVPGMNQCNPNFCSGWATWECGNGFVVGSGDAGGCPGGEGGVGIFQLDRGKWWVTVNSYAANDGLDITTTWGNTEGGIRHIINDLRVCWATPLPFDASDADVVAWLNTAIPDGRPEFEVFLSCMAKHYNGCGPTCGAHASVRAKYRAGVQQLINAFGWQYWYPPPPSGDCGTPHGVIGAIREKWEALGACAWGAPTTDEGDAANGGRYMHFDNGGSIYWTPWLGAHETHGAIRAHWQALNWEHSWLGYPVSDEYWLESAWFTTGPVAESEFEHGWLSYSFDTGQIFEWTK